MWSTRSLSRAPRTVGGTSNSWLWTLRWPQGCSSGSPLHRSARCLLWTLCLRKLHPQQPRPLWLFHQSRLRVFARLFSKGATWIDSPGFCGLSRRVTYCAVTRVSSALRRWWPSTRRATRSFTASWRATASALRATLPCRTYGTKPGTRRRRRPAVDRWAQWINIACDGSFPCPGPSGMEKRRCTASKSAPGMLWRTSISITGTRPRPREESGQDHRTVPHTGQQLVQKQKAERQKPVRGAVQKVRKTRNPQTQTFFNELMNIRRLLRDLIGLLTRLRQ